MAERLSEAVAADVRSTPATESLGHRPYEPASVGRARHSVRAGVTPNTLRRARSAAPYLEVHGEAKGWVEFRASPPPHLGGYEDCPFSNRLFRKPDKS